jgi:Ran GTPase-activating protein (RanGAP) involved in mRNA processing and transport
MNIHRLAEFVDICSDLVAIEFGGRGLGDDGCINAAKVLQGNMRVKTVNLSGNNIGYSGAKAFAALFGLSISTLVHLNLSRNNLGPSGGACLVKSLERNTCLLELHIDFNNIGNFGATQMVKPLTSNTCLLKLGLTSNGISTANADKIRIAVAKGRNESDMARIQIMF